MFYLYYLFFLFIFLNNFLLANNYNFNIKNYSFYNINNFNKNKKDINILLRIKNFVYNNIGNNLYIKYSNNYTTKVFIDFNNESIKIETISDKFYKEFIINEIINILSVYNFGIFNIITNKKNKDFHKNIFLKNINKYKKKSVLLLNLDKNIIEFSKFLINNKLKNKNINNSKIWYLNIKFNRLSDKNKIKKYINKIEKYSNKYKIDKYLILSIIKIESNFNKYAISNSGAIGIMQIIYNTAGKDVFNNNKKNNIKYLSSNMLFNPYHNIKIGIKYLYILKNKYFLNILNKNSLRYIIISSYNGGINNIIKIFGKNFSESLKLINNMDHNFVYKSIVNHHPSKEIREYLKKVNYLYNKYYYKKKY